MVEVPGSNPGDPINDSLTVPTVIYKNFDILKLFMHPDLEGELGRLYDLSLDAGNPADLGKLNKDVIGFVSEITDVPVDVLKKNNFYDELPPDIAGVYLPEKDEIYVERELKDDICLGKGHLFIYILGFAHELTHRVQKYKERLISYPSQEAYERDYYNNPNEKEANLIGRLAAYVVGPKYRNICSSPSLGLSC